MIDPDKHYIGFALDGKVEQMMVVDSRLAAIFLSEPEIVDLTNNPELEKHESGHVWSTVKNKWIAYQPFPSWTYDEESDKWNPPSPMPDDGFWVWNESKLKWSEAEENDISLG